MARQMRGPRKQRTRQHVIADLSVNYVERIMLEAGHVALRLTTDYGYDIAMTTFDAEGFTEPGLVLFQLKASDDLSPSGEFYTYDLDIRDYNLWRFEDMPVILILHDATKKKAYWLHVQEYFLEDASRRPKKGAKTIRVRVPSGRIFNRRAVQILRMRKEEAMLPYPRRNRDA